MNSRDAEVTPPDADLPESKLTHTPSSSFEREANFRYLFVINPLPMWVYDLQTLAFLEVNDAAVAIYGYSQDEFLRMRFTDIQLPDSRPYPVDDKPQELLPSQVSGQWRHRLKDGRLIDVEITSRNVEWAGRSAALVVAQDITEHKQMEQAQQASVQELKMAYEQATIYARELNKKITELKQAEMSLRHKAEQVHTAHERLRFLSQQLVDAQEVERRHIARELHDEIGQTLTAVKINLQALQRLSAASFAAPIAESMDIIEQAIQQVRNLSLDLRPSMLDDLGLVATLRWYLDRQARWAGFTAQFTANPSDMRLPSNLETVCFRLVQEALTNVLRHAQAQRVQVDLRQHETELQLLIHDDGRGFEVKTILERVARGTGLGLLGMQERVTLLGGRLDIDSGPGQGTKIRVYLPLPSMNSELQGE